MDTKKITDYIFLDDKDPKGDIAFVFGTWKAWEESTAIAAELYKKGLVPKIIVSGGKNPVSGINEGDLMSKELERLGVPKKAILVENESLNTLENVILSKKIVDNQIGFENIKTVVVVVKNFHARRALMTLKKHWPKNIQFRVLAYTSPKYLFTKNNWFETDLGKNKVMEEVEKIKKYLKKGDLRELN